MTTGCAKEGAPGGGPLDVYPPEIASHRPASGELGVPTGEVIEIEFSESMDRRSVENGLIVTPIRPGMKLRWKGRRLLIEGNALREDETTVITLLSSCLDKHGNSLGESYSWAFSTGDTIPTGLIRVSMQSRGAPVAGALALATFADDTAQALIRIGEADSTGVALVGWMDGGTYRMFAFRDANADLEYQFAVEHAGEDTVDFAAGDTVSIALDLAVADTIPPRLLRATALSARQIDLTYNEPVTGEGVYRVADEQGDTIAIMLVYADPEDPSLAHLILERDMASVDYWVSCLNITDEAGIPLSESEALFEGTSDPDVTPPEPRIVYVYTDSLVVDEPQVWIQVRVVWTEAVMDTLGAICIRSARDGRALAGEQIVANPQETVFTAAEPLASGEYATLSIAGGVTDGQGNASTAAMTALLGPEQSEIPIVTLAGSYITQGGMQ